ncbi:hypothetical protein ACW9VS_02870 [Bifidobacterium adolescentis]
MTTTSETLLAPPAPPSMDTVPVERRDEALKADLLARQAMRIADLQAQKESCDEEIDAIKRQILDTHEPGTYQASGLKVQVKTGSRRLDAKKFAAAYKPTEHPELFELKPKSLSSVEKLVGALNLEGMVVQGASTVVVS